MSRVAQPSQWTVLTREQHEELRMYADGEARKPSKPPNTNLIRRNMLMNVRATHGPGYYRITEFGKAALAINAPKDLPQAVEERRGAFEAIYRFVFDRASKMGAQ